jgi:hypothetical protein
MQFCAPGSNPRICINSSDKHITSFPAHRVTHVLAWGILMYVFPGVLLQGGQLKPQDLVEWQAFQAQRHWTLEVREAWVLDTVQARLATRAQQQLEGRRQQQQQARDTRQQQRQLDKSPGQQEQQQQQQETSAPDVKDDSTAVQPRCDQGDSTVPQADKLIQQAFAQQQDKQQQPTLPPDSTALQRATAGMMCRVQLGAVHSKLMEAKKQRTQQANEHRRQQQQQQQQERQERQQQQQQQQQRSREERLEEKLPNQPETYDLEVDITARLAGLSSRRQQQQQQQQPKQGSGTSRSSSSSGQASGSRAAASGSRRQQQQQQQLGCDGSSSGRDTLLQLLAVGEALFKADEGCKSDDYQADAQVGLEAQTLQKNRCMKGKA